MPSVGFELTISAGERPQTYALDRSATGTGETDMYWSHFIRPSSFERSHKHIEAEGISNCKVVSEEATEAYEGLEGKSTN
jgi:hypothetical protein